MVAETGARDGGTFYDLSSPEMMDAKTSRK